MPLFLFSTILILSAAVDGFALLPSSSRLSQISSPASALNVGNFLSGVSGVAPSSLLTPKCEESLVDSTSLAGKRLECCYKASRDGWSATDFHKAVDERGSGLVIGLTRSGKILGGFNPLGWRSSDDYGQTNSAFLFFVAGNDDAVKCPVLAGGGFLIAFFSLL